MLPTWMKSGKILKKQEETEEKTNIRKFQVIDGGLKTGGKEPPVNDWLSSMTPGTIFLAVERVGFEPICGMFTVKNTASGEENFDIAVELLSGGSDFWVVANRFCHKMKLVAVLERGLSD